MISISNAAITTSVVNNRSVATLTATVTESVLPNVVAAISWGDGQVATVGPAASPQTFTLTHAYASPGTYSITVVAANLASPVPASVSWSGTAVFGNPGYTPTAAASTPAYIGPIMPRTDGYPSPSTWNWQFGTDNALLVSSLTLLLSTAKGERLMDPNFGTNLRQLVFSLQGPIVDDAAFGDVSQAIATYEPRVELTTLQATPAGGRVINIAATASSLINGKSVALQSTSGGVNQ